MSEVQMRGKAAKTASYQIVEATTEEKNTALLLIAEQLIEDQATILDANKKDVNNGRENGLDKSVLDRIMLNEERIEAMANAIKSLVDLHDPIGEILEERTLDNGLNVNKVRVPIGVRGMIYEARPNVTIDAATLALKTSNAVILRVSCSAIHYNIAIVGSIYCVLKHTVFPLEAVQLIEDTARETAQQLFKLNYYLDVLIPRGGEKLIQMVVHESTVPVIETGAGNCHAFIDASAKQKMAEEIVLNAKLQRPSV